MSIKSKPKTAPRTAESFMAAAPDAAAAQAAQTEQPAVYEKGIAKGNKRQITLTITPEMLRQVDETAKRTGQARAAIINMALYRAFEGDIFK